MNRRNFLRFGALFVPAIAAPVVYSFPCVRQENWLDRFAEDWNMPPRLAAERDEAFRDRIKSVFGLGTRRGGA